MSEKELYSVAEFLHRYEIGRTSFYALVAKKEIPTVLRGRRRFVARNDAEAWLERLRKQTVGGVA